jgi:methyl-accepting chemotaxis protein
MFQSASVGQRLTYNTALQFFFLAAITVAACAGAANGWIIALAVIAFIVTTPATAVLIRNLTIPLKDLSAGARVIAQGDLSRAMDVQRRRDEIGELNRNLQAILEYLQQSAALTSAIAGGNLSVQVRPQSPNDVLSHALSDMIGGLSEIVHSIRTAATQVAAGAEQVATTSQETAQASVQASRSIDDLATSIQEMRLNANNVIRNTRMQAESVTQTSSAVDEILSSFLQTATNIMRLCDISDRSREQVQTGLATAARANEGLQQINTSISSTAEIVAALGERASSIGNIVDVIDDIAEQTNLLALNAAIEAARAGQHGLGFAIVADEVRKLAEKSAQSTSEINALIRSIQDEAVRAVHNMEKSTAIVSEGMKTGTELTGALGNISDVVSDFNRLAQEVGAATNEQSEASGRIGDATSRLKQITDEISSSVQQQADATESAVAALEHVRGVVQRFNSSTAELATTAGQMMKMSKLTVDAVKGFVLEDDHKPASIFRFPEAGPAVTRDRSQVKEVCRT